MKHSSLNEAPCAPKTLEMLAQFCVMTRLKRPENSLMYSKMRVYNGENLKESDPKAKSLQGANPKADWFWWAIVCCGS